jgi:hypothetical protein
MEGIIAYAKRQAAMRCEMRERFEMRWRYAGQRVEAGEIPDDERGEDDWNNVVHLPGGADDDFIDFESLMDTNSVVFIVVLWHTDSIIFYWRLLYYSIYIYSSVPFILFGEQMAWRCGRSAAKHIRRSD